MQVVAALKCTDDVLGVAPQTTTLFRLEVGGVLRLSETVSPLTRSHLSHVLTDKLAETAIRRHNQ